MSIRIICPRCQAARDVPEEQRGQTLRCEECANPVLVAVRTQPPAQPGGLGKILLLVSAGAVPALLVVAVATFFGLRMADTFRPTKIPADEPSSDALAGGSQPPQDLAGNADPGAADPPPDLVPTGLLPQDPVPLDVPPPDTAAANPATENPPAVIARDGQLPQDVLTKVKRATVYLRITLPDGQVAQGSGFFGVEPGIVLTNAHVVGMLLAESPKPRRVDVVLNSGEPDARTFPAQIVAVDRGSDLAVLRVAVKDQPEPLRISNARDLRETQPVYIFGFPFGEQLGKNITISSSSVSSLRKDGQGLLQKVQVNGGMNPGNSGGPVVDDRGRVIGVAVAVILATQINFAVPGERVNALLDGRVVSLDFGQPYRDGPDTKVPVAVELLDPLGRLRKTGLDWWLGVPPARDGQTRPPSAAAPAAQSGDGPRQTVELKGDKEMARGEIILSTQPGKVLWVQPAYESAGGRRWASACVCRPPPPVERRPTELTARHPQGSRPVELITRSTEGPRETAPSERPRMAHSAVTWSESSRAQDEQGSTNLRLEYQSIGLGFLFDKKPQPRTPMLQWLVTNAHSLAADVQLDRQGNPLQSRPDLRQVPPSYQNAFTQLNQQLEQSLESVLVPLPGGEVEVGRSWQAKRNLLDGAVLDLTYTYRGVRTREGREEAVVAVAGLVQGRPRLKISGRARGTALVDVATGLVTLERTLIDFDVENVVSGGRLMQSSATLEIQLRRGFGRQTSP